MQDDLYPEKEQYEKWTPFQLLILALLVVLLITVGVSVANRFNKSSQSSYDLINPPIQSQLRTKETLTITASQAETTLTKVAEYEVRAVVKGVKTYNDAMGPLAPYDFALAWGELNRKEVNERIKYSQSGRWYYYYVDNINAVSLTTVAHNSSNHHLVVVDAQIREQLSRVRVNDYVHLKGYLVNLNHQGRSFETSTTRKDTGGGACEIMLVEEVRVY